MAISFDAANKRIVLDSTSVSAAEIFSRWEDWAATGDNGKYLPAFRHLGGDDLGGGLYVANYFFLLNGWRVRPMEANHALTITGNLFVEGGGIPVVNTLGAFNVSVQYTVPVQAQGIATGGGGGLTAAQVWDYIIENGESAQNLMRLLVAVAVGRTEITDNGDGTATVSFFDLAGTKHRVTGLMTGSERTSVTLDPT